MRSCGGAVQGLREPVHNNQDPIYLNRANDGFVFFDNGCYTYGPVKRQADDKYLQSLMVGNFKSRVVMFGNGHQDDDSSAIFQWKKSGALFDENPPMIETEPAPCALNVDFVETIMCSKASPMQPWMLQRAKWQKATLESSSPNNPSAEKEHTSLNDSRIQCWSLTQSAAEFYSWLWSLADDDDHSKEEGTVVQAGILCEATGEVNVIARHYDSSDDLKQVLFAEGILQSDSK
mmetsp:Transcript_21574/g.53359  ORF Transcript_21574/g.53359 Transcript_21574/m.53359 type:complete len:233 (-) Transcript_21574:250-948(-)